MPLSTETEALQRRLLIGKEQFPHYGPFLDFWEKILLIQSHWLDRITDESPAVPDSLIQTKLREGFPLISFKELRVDPERLRDLFQEILSQIERANPKMEQQFPLIEAWLQEEGRDFQPWINRLFQEDGQPFTEAAEKSGLDPGILFFLFLTCWKPFLKARARILTQREGIDWTAWDRGYCPVCGGMPLVAYLQEGGRRTGVCSLCETSWDLTRFLCPQCHNTDQATLRYFYSESEKGFRLEVCDACRHYLKTIDLREWGGTPVSVVDDVLTTHLDIWAREQGYQRLPFSERIV